MADPVFSDPLVWRSVKAPSLEEMLIAVCERTARPEEDVLDELDAQTEFDLLGLFQGVGLPFRSESAPTQMPNMIWLYRRPILDYWADHDETLGAIITHVLVHEIGHHFGLSDDDMTEIEASVA